mgnify:FL=1
MISIIGRRNSANVQKVMWTVGELGIEYTRQDMGGSFGYSDEYSQLNPNQVVPTIRDGDLSLWESNACVRYLARTYGKGSLWPTDNRTLALADQWMEWQRSDISSAFFPLFQNKIKFSADQVNADQMTAGADQCARLYHQLDQHLEQSPYLAGDEFTMADIPLGTITYRYLNLDIERIELPHVSRWYQRLCERPAFRYHVMIPFGANAEEWLQEEINNAKIQ